MKKRILCRRYHYRDHDFFIATGEDGVARAIDYKYIKNGVLTQELNGLDMYCDPDRNTLPEIIERINYSLDLRAFFAERRINMAGLTKNDVEKITKLLIEFHQQRGDTV